MTSEFDTEKTSGGRTRGSGAAGAGRPEGGHPGLRVIQKASDHPCFQCAKCCTYVAVEIDSPGTMKEYDHIVWYLYHEGVSVFVDWNSDWFIKFETRCQHLTQEGMCGIYDRRPGICKDFDWRECENNVTDEPPDKWLFEDADTFMRWFEKQRPKTYKRYLRFLRRKHREDQDPELSRVSGGGRRRAPTRR